jgi:hypothetical protein
MLHALSFAYNAVQVVHARAVALQQLKCASSSVDSFKRRSMFVDNNALVRLSAYLRILLECRTLTLLSLLVCYTAHTYVYCIWLHTGVGNYSTTGKHCVTVV